MARSMYVPKEGNVRNPLHCGKIRNMPCPCDSGKKVKKCCGRAKVIKKEALAPVKKAADMLKEGTTVKFIVREENGKEEGNQENHQA